MTSFGGAFGIEKGITIRPSSTANLMVDSADRPNPTTSSPFDFQISKGQALLNGFFTRVATTEVVLEWCMNNVPDTAIVCDISGVNHTINVVGGLYTVSELLNEIVNLLDGLSIPKYNFSINNAVGGGYVGIFSGAGNLDYSFISDDTGLLNRLGIELNQYQPEQLVVCPDLRPYRYIDFVSSQLTYPQDLRDASTNKQVRDVLCRWYFADDGPEALDQYGFPILMGYTRFCRRRLFNPPKYIKWDNTLPVGNLAFQVYGNDGNIVSSPSNVEDTNWLMTLQLSEN